MKKVKRCLDCSALIKHTSTRCVPCNADARRSILNPRWKGGKHQRSDGYVGIRTLGHPRARKSSQFRVMEHTLVMEKKLGRYLLPGEEVHHKNGIRNDNRLKNLELWVVRQPKGQRPKDLVRWAEEILALYGGKRGAI